MPDSSVVIVNFNAGPFLREAVASALECPGVSGVVIVDNASSDDSLDLVPRDERILIVRNDRTWDSQPPAISESRARARTASCCSIPIAASRPERSRGWSRFCSRPSGSGWLGPAL
jgi:GT2 family glycosyltransferase